jgi:hypothetical protein
VLATTAVEAEPRQFVTRLFGVRRLAIGEGSVWVVSSAGQDVVLSRFDPETGARAGRVVLEGAGGAPARVAVGAGAAWVAHARGLSRVDSRNGAITGTLPLPSSTLEPGLGVALAVGRDSVWVAHGIGGMLKRDRAVLRISADTNAVLAVIPLPALYAPLDVAVHQGRVWVSGAEGVNGPYVLYRVDPEGRQPVEKVARWRHDLPIRLLTTGRALWAFGISRPAVGARPWLGRIDPEGTTTVLDLGVGGDVADVAVDDDTIWVVRAQHPARGVSESFLERLRLPAG